MVKNILSGRVFGRLTVVEISGYTTRRETIWRCQCECGNVRDVRSDNLTGNKIRSCGCLLVESRSNHRSVPRGFECEYRIWMENRKKLWNISDFEQFITLAGRRPVGSVLSINNNQPVWISRSEASQRRAPAVTIQGAAKSVRHWAKQLGISRQAMYVRLAKSKDNVTSLRPVDLKKQRAGLIANGCLSHR